MSNLELKNITLVAVSSVRIEETIDALKNSMIGIDYFDVILITHEKPSYLPSSIIFKQCPKIKSIKEYNQFILFELYKYIDSDFALVVQYDGYVLRPDKWNDNFLEYDYIGAPWRKGNYFTSDGANVRVGNGGFSLRSKKLLESFNKLNISFVDRNISDYHEDAVICVFCKKELERYGIKFPQVSVASKFSREEKFSDSELETFGFHEDKHVLKDKLKNLVKNIFNIFGINQLRYSDIKVVIRK